VFGVIWEHGGDYQAKEKLSSDTKCWWICQWTQLTLKRMQGKAKNNKNLALSLRES